MNIRSTVSWIVIAVCLLWSEVAFAKLVTVSSLKELLPYLEKDRVNLKMTPGIYTVTGKATKAGEFGVQAFQSDSRTIFLITGSNSSYDFTGVTIQIETSVCQSLGKNKIHVLQIQGNRNLVKNLTLTDIGSVDDAPRYRATNVVMDGAYNRIEGLKLTTIGSFPYGYGELFGKGAGPVIKHRKKSSVLVRGDFNTLQGCDIVQRSFGHGIFMQAAHQPTISKCKVKGEMRSTDEVLAEKDSVAAKVNFMTTWGYKVPPGHTISLCEAGIRAYAEGVTYVDGKTLERKTENPTATNCEITNMRSGVMLHQASGKKSIRGCTVIGCSTSFSIGSGDITNCSADVQYGPVFELSEKQRGINAEITLLPFEGESGNASGQAAIIAGQGHRLFFKGKLKNPKPAFTIQVGGDSRRIGELAEDENFEAVGVKISNVTGYPVLLEKGTKDCAVKSRGKITDKGRNNLTVQAR